MKRVNSACLRPPLEPVSHAAPEPTLVLDATVHAHQLGRSHDTTTDDANWLRHNVQCYPMTYEQQVLNDTALVSK